MTEENAEKMRSRMPAEEWEEKQRELKVKAEQASAPPLVFIKDAWLCFKCECMNEGALEHCFECKEPRPFGALLDEQKKAAKLKQEKALEEHKAKIRANTPGYERVPLQ